MKKFTAKFKIILTLAALSLGMILPAFTVLAVPNPVVVQFETSPLFGENDIKPGDIIAKWIRVGNYSGDDLKVSISAENFTNPIPSDDLARALNIEIKKGSAVLYGPVLLSDFYSAGLIYLSTISDGNTEQYDVVISFPFDKGNEWQTKTTGFDVKISYQGNGQDDGDGDGQIQGEVFGSLGGGGGSVISTGLYIYNEQAAGGGTSSALINWQTNLFSSSKVIYSEAGQSHNFDPNSPPNYGYANSNTEDGTQVTGHSMVISGLKPATTYYFRCFSQNSSEHAISGELTFTTGGVAGTFTEESGNSGSNSGGTGGLAVTGGAASQEASGTVAGASFGNLTSENQEQCFGDNCEGLAGTGDLENLLASVAIPDNGFCWIFLLVIIILLAWYLWRVIKKESGVWNKMLPIVIFLLLVWYVWKCCPTCDLTCCYWFWILLLADIILTLFSVFYKKK